MHVSQPRVQKFKEKKAFLELKSRRIGERPSKERGANYNIASIRGFGWLNHLSN